MKNILYLDTVMGITTTKALKKYINYKNLDNINLSILQDKSLLYFIDEIITLDEDLNYNEHFYDAFFIDSFRKDNRYNFQYVEHDYNVVKEDLPYTIDFVGFYEQIKNTDKLIEKILDIDPEYTLLRIIGDRIYLSYYIAFKLKAARPNMKIIAGGEKDLRKSTYYHNLFLDLVDHLYFGFAEHLLTKLNNDEKIEKMEYSSDFTEDLWRSYNFGITDEEIKAETVYLIPNISCVYNCRFCSVRKDIKNYNTDTKLEEFTDYIIFLNKKYPGICNFFSTSLAFRSNEEIEYFFGRLYDNNLYTPDKFNLGVCYITSRMYWDNKDLLKKFGNNNRFYIGVESLSDSVLKHMRKPNINSDINKKLVLGNNNINYAFIWNYFNETMEEFQEMLRFSTIIKKLKYTYPRFFKLQWSSDESQFQQNEIDFDITFKVPHTYKNYFNIAEEYFFFDYYQNTDKDYEILKYKQNILNEKGFTVDGFQ